MSVRTLSISSLHEMGFHVRSVISNNHAINVGAFDDLVAKYENVTHTNSISHPSLNGVITYLFYDSVHLMKNIRNNLLNCRQFSFLPIQFDHDSVNVPGGEIYLRLLHDVHDQLLQSNLQKTFKLSYKAWHPCDKSKNI